MFVLAHVSDLHVSEYGDTFHDRLRVVSRSARPGLVDEDRFDEVWAGFGWRILRQRETRRERLVLLDPEGYRHPIPAGHEGGPNGALQRGTDKALALQARRASTLAAELPTASILRELYEETPHNSNLRLLRAVASIEESAPDAVVITGDITDDGAGWELVRAAFQRYIRAGRLFAIPGNHDLYMFPLRGSSRPRPTYMSKRRAWNSFAESLGLRLHSSGAWWQAVPEGQLVLVGLDSCQRSQRRFFRQNGAVGAAQLAFLREISKEPGFRSAKHRLLLLHHHVVPLPHGVGRRAPSEIGMRLDDARAAAQVFEEVGITGVLHGHRHVSEQRQPAGSRFTILASPSLTLGCRSGDAPSFWRIELGEHMHASRVYVASASIDQDEDPDESRLRFGVEPFIVEPEP